MKAPHFHIETEEVEAAFIPVIDKQPSWAKPMTLLFIFLFILLIPLTATQIRGRDDLESGIAVLHSVSPLL